MRDFMERIFARLARIEHAHQEMLKALDIHDATTSLITREIAEVKKDFIWLVKNSENLTVEVPK